MKILIKRTDPSTWGGGGYSCEHKSHYFTMPNLNETI